MVFARFVMRDSGLPIHINTPHVTQVRLTIDGEPAIYLVGKETPILVEGTLEGALKKLEAAAAGLRLVEPEAPPAPVSAVVTPTPVVEPPPPSPIALEKPEAPKKAARKSAVARAAKPAKGKASLAKGAAEPDTAPSATSWFKGLR